MKNLALFLIVIGFAISSCKKETKLQTPELTYPYIKFIEGTYKYHYQNDESKDTFSKNGKSQDGFVMYFSSDSVFLHMGTEFSYPKKFNDWRGKLDSTGHFKQPYGEDVIITRDTIIYSLEDKRLLFKEEVDYYYLTYTLDFNGKFE